MAEQKDTCSDCGRPQARDGAAWNRDHNRAMPGNSPTCGRHLGSFWIDESLPDCKGAELDRLRAQLASKEATVLKLLGVVEAAKRFREGGGPVAMTELFIALAAIEGDEGRGGR